VKLKDKVAVVTGGASGIGAALCRRFAEEGARAVVVVDCNEDGAKAVAEEIGGGAIGADVSVEADVINVVNETESRFGRIDLFCSNAGISSMDGPTAASAPNDMWQSSWEVNLMAHVYAARAVLPKMIERGDGYLLSTSSAAGVLSQIGSAPYSVSKHAAVAFAECLAIAHGHDGIKVSVLCPQAVRTPMLGGSEDGAVGGVDGVLEPSEVADCVIEALDEERFLILPHPEVLTYVQRKTSDYDRWLRGMQRLRTRFVTARKEREYVKGN
jgi:NAD(P)-dependent dehydrogenase (short-subunit alcohol dehydrogenase family)